MKHLQTLRNIFLKAVDSVRPVNLLSAANNYILRPQPDSCDKNGHKSGDLCIQLQGKKLNINNKRCHVVGFGKAVLGMAVQLELALEDKLLDGILSVPVGTLEKFKDNAHMQLSCNSRIAIVEGALNNQPDESALIAAQRIKHMAESMTDEDILFALISGGGSALLPMPRPPLTLEQKMTLVRSLANRGATIDEMNIVRIALSDIKGGKLAAAARHAHSIVSFVISDIVNDPVDLIASGPTCAPVAKRTTAHDILAKYQLWNDLLPHIQELILTPILPSKQATPASNNLIYVIGDNRVAATTAVQEAVKCGFNPFIVSTAIQGDVQELTVLYTKFLTSICAYRGKAISELELKQAFPFDTRLFQHFHKTLLMCEKTGKPLLLILAGESTVHVKGRGRGGRNQELALRMSLELYKDSALRNICFLSAGTDGIDGPTPAAGALGGHAVIEHFLASNGESNLHAVEQFLDQNDSYTFYSCLDNGHFHILTGHTGTNVMDLHLILVE